MASDGSKCYDHFKAMADRDLFDPENFQAMASSRCRPSSAASKQSYPAKRPNTVCSGSLTSDQRKYSLTGGPQVKKGKIETSQADDYIYNNNASKNNTMTAQCIITREKRSNSTGAVVFANNDEDTESKQSL